MGDGILLTRFMFGLMVAGPLIPTTLVFLLRRSRITRVARYFLASIATGYVMSVGVPLGIVLVSILLGAVAETAALVAIVLSIPALITLQTAAAVFWSRRLGEGSAQSGATTASVGK